MSGSMNGQVINQRDGQPIQSANCVLRPNGGSKATDGEGNFAYADLPAGNYELLVSKEGFKEGIYGPLVVMEGAPTKLTLALQPKDW